MNEKGLLWQILNSFKPKTSAPAPVAPPPRVAPQAPAEPTEKTETHKVAGISYRESAVISLASKDDDYYKDKRDLIRTGLTDVWINEYIFLPRHVELIPEQDNPKDPKAVRVVVDGQHIGYIKAGSCAHIRKLLESGKIQKVTCKMGGGPGKIVREDVNDYGKTSYSLEKENRPFYAHLSIVVSTV